MGLLNKIKIDPVVYYERLPDGLTGQQWAAPIVPPTDPKMRVTRTVDKDFGVDRDIGLAVGQIYTGGFTPKVGDIIWPGALADAPQDPPRAYEILRFITTKNARGTKVVRIAVYGTKGGGD